MTDKSSTSSRFSRRTLLKWSCVAGGGVAVASMLPSALFPISRARAAQFTQYRTGTWTPSCCNMCGGQCGIDVYVEDGLVRKIEPQGGRTPVVSNPNTIANNSQNFVAASAAGDTGRICCKGNSGIKSLYDPERLQTPMRRVGERGTDLFEPITWEEAIEETARNLVSIRNRFGARSMVWFGEDHSFTHIQSDFCKAYGSPNYSNHANLCDTSRKSSFRSTIGDDRPLADMENADTLLVFGWNFLSAIKWIHLASIFTRARMTNPNFHFIYVDPVHNTTASKADRWVALRPGSDGALALALCKRLITAGTPNVADMAAYAFGYDEFVKYLNADATGAYDYSTVPWAGVEIGTWASGVTGIPLTEIDALAARLVADKAAGRKICIDAWSGPGHHSNATQSGRAIGALAILLGVVDSPGGLCFPLRSGPSSRPALGTWPAANGWRVDGRDNVTVPATFTYPGGGTVTNPYSGAIKKKFAYSHGSGIYVEQRQRMIEQTDFVGNPYPIKAAVFVFQNFLMSTPNVEKSVAAINNMEFVLCVDTHMSETAQMADIVIPGSNYLERADFNANWILFRSVGLRQKVVPSWIGGMSETDFFLRLGSALGFDGFMTSTATMSDEDFSREEWDRFVTTGGWTNNAMLWPDLKAGGTWIETFKNPDGSLNPTGTPSNGATTTPKGGTHYRKYKATKTFATGDTVTATTTTGSTQTVYVVKNAAGTALGIGTGATMAVGDVYEVGFGTQTRRLQFWDPMLAGYFAGTTQRGDQGGNQNVTGDLRYHPLPYNLPPEDAPATPGSGTYPLYFVSWKEVEHAHTRTFNNPYLMEMRGENRLFMHPTVATAGGIQENDQVFVQSAHGAIKVRAHITTGIQRETVGFVRGFGHWALGSLAVGRGAHDGWLLPGKAELHSGQAVCKEVACRIYKEV